MNSAAIVPVVKKNWCGTLPAVLLFKTREYVFLSQENRDHHHSPQNIIQILAIIVSPFHSTNQDLPLNRVPLNRVFTAFEIGVTFQLSGQLTTFSALFQGGKIYSVEWDNGGMSVFYITKT